MVFLDSNIFIIDRFFPRDVHYEENRMFFASLKNAKAKAGVPLITLLEICGVASFNLSQEELEKWLYSFGEVYPVEVLDPAGDEGVKIGEYLLDLGFYLTKKMTLGDAVFLKEAETYKARAIVTWNKKHFSGRTEIPVFTPGEYLAVFRAKGRK
ncbi:MAG: type II toxin-antitoxin system VapC family toxin [Firmicutes bacterium]|nr:type II toxin-antitoxin system VapC family toxin [Bacillota bacterium]